MWIVVEIASLSQAVQTFPLPFLRPPSWIFVRRRRRIFSILGGGSGVDTGFVYLAGRWAKLRVDSEDVGLQLR